MEKVLTREGVNKKKDDTAHRFCKSKLVEFRTEEHSCLSIKCCYIHVSLKNTAACQLNVATFMCH